MEPLSTRVHYAKERRMKQRKTAAWMKVQKWKAEGTKREGKITMTSGTGISFVPRLAVRCEISRAVTSPGNAKESELQGGPALAKCNKSCATAGFSG
ncbi:MAG: hypothetical protein DMG61_20885 [Acidobacteria bacterium]|nr:MAG: hypothetical protein DMG61_20885 [Acidobacteriota bacterium]PYY20414.1 MAG: hypothetical protein DMG60_00495 [Acidobacteriota bacterium]